MSDSDISHNPFAALFPSLGDVQTFRQTCSESAPPLDVDYRINVTEKELVARPLESEPESVIINAVPSSLGRHGSADHESQTQEPNITYLLEEVFRITLDPDVTPHQDRPSRCVFLDGYKSISGVLDLASVEGAVFERLVMDEPSQQILVRGPFSDRNADVAAAEDKVIYYLYQCMYRLQKLKSKFLEKEFEKLQIVIVSQAATCLSHPDIYPGNKIQEQLFYLLEEYHSERGHEEVLERFIKLTTDCIKERFDTEGEEVSLLEVLSYSFSVIKKRLSKISIADRSLILLLEILQYFAKSPPVALALITYSTPGEPCTARGYQESLLGLLLSVSCLPRKETDPYEFFDRPSQYTAQDHNSTEKTLWICLKIVSGGLYHLFNSLLRKSAETRNKTLQWIGGCLNACSDRGKLWNNHPSELFAPVQAGDGFVLNLGAVLLKLCKPFSEPFSPKLLKIHYAYCSSEARSEEEAHQRFIHLKGLPKETCLIPRDATTEDKFLPNGFNFSTECFFATHRALGLGFRIIHERLARLSQDLNRIRRVYEEARIQGGDGSEVVRRLQENMERGMTRFLSMKAALLEPETLEQMLQFHIATATWLCHVATSSNLESFQSLSLPFSEVGSHRLGYIPELIVENITDCAIFVRRFSEKTFEIIGNSLEHLMTLILIFMGSPNRMNNPHLRAKLAEMLEALMPNKDDDRLNSFISNVHREVLFCDHPFVDDLIPTLLHVFVSIEMTGQSVTFEQKFHYRRPMYIVLDNLWNLQRHKDRMKRMAIEAEENIENANPPIFLRFINLLMNDAIFLLDEALSYMSRLRELQQQRDRNAWAALPPSQRQQNESNFQHLGVLAHFHNVMGTETIHTLAWITSEIKSIFCHPTMVDRIATMLNYFLLHLVGPKKKNLKVKDLKEYEFKPQELVQNICYIYANLGSPDTQDALMFCSAVSKDGRSYSPDLFPQAEIVLGKIGQNALAVEVNHLSAKIKQLAADQQKEEEAANDAPEEFLDPIMSTIMRDPVILPSSGMIIDRSTIARHLLSDQTDPFNRSPLTMEMVKSDQELKKRIENWRADRLS